MAISGRPLWHGGRVTSTPRRERFEALVPALVEPLRRYLARRTDAATADDVLGDTLLVCWRRLDEVPPGDEVPWAYGVARNCLANAERSARRQRRVAARIATLDPPLEPARAERHDAEADEAVEVRRAVAALPERDAELVRLWAWEQLGPSEIARVLDITPNAASIRLHRARARLRDELRKIHPTDGHEESREGKKS